MDEKRPFYELPLAFPVAESGMIEVRRDIAYTEDGDAAALMDIYLPEGASQETFPPLLFLHGGPLPPAGTGPLPKEWRVFQDYGRLAAANGMAGVVINHRYAGYEGLVQAQADVRQALNFLAENDAELGLDVEKTAFSGAGMLLGALLDGAIVRPRSVVAFYPMLDLTHIPQATGVYSEEQLIALSPLSLIDRVDSRLPLFVARAGLDRAGLNRALDTFVKQALYHNLDLELRNLPRSGHNFDMFEESTAVQETIRRGIDFVRNHYPGS
jgi:acetyl esterase/lipase